MPQFANPFPFIQPNHQLTRDEILSALRQNLAAEEEAVHLYNALVALTKDYPLIQAQVTDIIHDEITHAAKFMELIDILTNGEEGKYMKQGKDEFNALVMREHLQRWLGGTSKQEEISWPTTKGSYSGSVLPQQVV